MTERKQEVSRLLREFQDAVIQDVHLWGKGPCPERTEAQIKVGKAFKAVIAAACSDTPPPPTPRRPNVGDANVCEHGDHPAPEGKRFCSRACAECERADFDDTTDCCAGLCGLDDETPTEETGR